MDRKNRELLEQLMEAVWAKDRLEAVRRLVDATEGGSVDKRDLLALLEPEEGAWEE